MSVEPDSRIGTLRREHRMMREAIEKRCLMSILLFAMSTSFASAIFPAAYAPSRPSERFYLQLLKTSDDLHDPHSQSSSGALGGYDGAWRGLNGLNRS